MMCHSRIDHAAVTHPTRICVIAQLLIGLLLGGCSGTLAARAEPLATATVRIREQTLRVEVAQTAAQKALGLGQRDALAPDHGMLFPYAKADTYAFWMKGMRFAIDIVWIRENRIVDISASLPPAHDGTLTQYRPRAPADQVLEVAAGYAARHGWAIGDAVTLEAAPDKKN